MEYEKWIKRMKEARELYLSAAVNGDPKDWAAYKEVVGIIQGLAIAEREMQIVSEEMEKNGIDLLVGGTIGTRMYFTADLDDAPKARKILQRIVEDGKIKALEIRQWSE